MKTKMRFKLNIRTKMLVYLLIIPSVVFLMAAFILLNKFRYSYRENIISILENQSELQAKSLVNSCQIHVNQINNGIITFQSTNEYNIDGQKDILYEFLHATINNNPSVISIWADLEMSYLYDNPTILFGRERQVMKREINGIEFEKQFFDTISEDAGSDYYRMKVDGQGLIADFTFITGIEDNTDYYSFIYTAPLKKNNKIVGGIGAEIKIEGTFLKKEYDNCMINSFIINKNRQVICHAESFNNSKFITGLFDENTIETHNLNKIIFNGIPVTFKAHDPLNGQDHIYALHPVKIIPSGSELTFGSYIPYHMVIKQTNKTFLLLLVVGVLVIVILGILIWIFGNYLSRTIFETGKILKRLSYGDINIEKRLYIKSNDELQSMGKSVNSLIDGLNLTAGFAKEIGKGNLDISLNKLSDKDILGESLIEMKDSLQKAKIEEEKRRKEDAKQTWATQGLAKFSDILRENTGNLEDFSYNVLTNLIKYINANQGALYVINEDGENNKYIELTGCYAYERKKYLEKKIDLGEGLVGRCVLERATIYLTDIPKDYINITSGLGHDNPSSLLLVPLILNEEIYGVIEIASFKKFEVHEINFVEKIGQSIASTISNVKVNLRTSELLEESKIQAEELAAQEEEMRQNLEELQATQEESARKEAEMSGMVAAMNASLLVAECDMEGNILSMNTEFASILNKNKNELIGENYKNLVATYGMATEKIDQIWQNLQKREIVKNISHFTFDESEIWINQTFAPIINNEGNPYKILNLAIDITESKIQERQVKKLLEDSQSKNEELEKIQKEMAKEKALMDALMENIPDSIYFKDIDSRFLRISNSLVAKFKASSAEDIIGKTDFDFHGKQHAQEAFNDEQNIIKTGKPLLNIVEKEEFDDGRLSWGSTTKMPLKDKKGNIIGTFGITKDITEIKNMELKALEKTKEVEAAEEVLKQNLEELQATQEELTRAKDNMEQEKALMDALMENIPDSIYFKDLQSRFIRASHSMAGKFLASSIEEIYGKSDFDFQGKKHAQEAFNDEQNIIRTGKPLVNIVEKEEFDDGRLSWGSTTKMPLRDKKGNIIGTFGITKDITEIKTMELQAIEKTREIEAAEEELRQNLEELQATQEELNRAKEELEKEKSLMDALMENIPDSIYFKDLKSRFIRASHSMASKFLVSSIEEIYGKSDFDFHGKQHSQEAFNDEQNIIKTGKPIINIVEKEEYDDGRLTWGATTKMQLRDKKGNIIGTFGITKDITEIKNLELELLEKNKKLEALIKQKGKK